MKRRLMFGPVLIALLLGLMWLDQWLADQSAPAGLSLLTTHDGRWQPGLILVFIGLLACGRAGYELSRMFQAAGIQASAKSLTFCAAAGLLAGVLTIGPLAPLHDIGAEVLGSAAGLALFLTMLAYIRDRDVKGAGGAVASAVLAFVYVGVMLGFLMALRREHSVWLMVMMILTVKACDSGAYFVGSAIGKHKLIPWISPGKTWEGLVGGVLTSAACGVGLAALGHEWGALASWARLGLAGGGVLGLLLGIFGQLGDLSASVLKRDAGIKDAGRILPGFGGLVDMLDSLLITAPLTYWYLATVRG
ncbi:MAG: phosphatidate cytidylyltransferase [Phycisphaerales bacterium]